MGVERWMNDTMYFDHSYIPVMEFKGHLYFEHASYHYLDCRTIPISIFDEELFSGTAVGCTASYFVKII